MSEPIMFNICGLGKKNYTQPPTQKDHELSVLKRLTGKQKHLCVEWDGLAIDEGSPEFEACLCFKDPGGPR